MVKAFANRPSCPSVATLSSESVVGRNVIRPDGVSANSIKRLSILLKPGILGKGLGNLALFVIAKVQEDAVTQDDLLALRQRVRYGLATLAREASLGERVGSE